VGNQGPATKARGGGRGANASHSQMDGTVKRFPPGAGMDVFIRNHILARFMSHVYIYNRFLFIHMLYISYTDY
jgi:hypothetical protein